MSDLIDRKAAINAVNTALFPKINTAKDAEKALRALPSAERHGRWIYTPTNILGYVCSECGKAMCRFNYCPHCGALMDEVAQ